MYTIKSIQESDLQIQNQHPELFWNFNALKQQQPTPIINYDPMTLLNIFDGFCLCGLNSPSLKSQSEQCKKECKREIKERRSIHTHDFTKNIAQLQSALASSIGTGSPFVTAKTKAHACRTKRVSKRRSKFTGVTKNSSNYQALIVIKGKKTYVASFEQELFAALTFDFYSLLLRGQRAVTNYSYSGEEVKQMLASYTMNDNDFDPSLFAYKAIANH